MPPKDIFERVDALIEKRDFKKAFSILKKFLKQNPDDIRALLKIGEVCFKDNRPEEGKEYFLKVVAFYRKEGFLLKAISVYKILSEKFPDNPEIHYELGDLFKEMGLFSDAVARYKKALMLFHKQGRIEEKLLVIKKILDINTENIMDRVKLAEALLKLKRTDEAKEQFKQAAIELYKRNEVDAFIKVAERYTYFEPDDFEINKQLAKIYFKKKNYLKTLEKLQFCVEQRPKSAEILEMIAEVFLQLGEIEKAKIVLREIVNIFEREENEKEKQRFLNKLSKIESRLKKQGEMEGAEFDKGIEIGDEVEFEDFAEATVIQGDTPFEFKEIKLDFEKEEEKEGEKAIFETPFEDEFDFSNANDIEDTVVATDFDFSEFADEVEGFEFIDSEESKDGGMQVSVEKGDEGKFEIKEILPEGLVADIKEFEFYLKNGMLEEAMDILSEIKSQYSDYDIVNQLENKVKGIK